LPYSFDPAQHIFELDLVSGLLVHHVDGEQTRSLHKIFDSLPMDSASKREDIVFQRTSYPDFSVSEFLDESGPSALGGNWRFFSSAQNSQIVCGFQAESLRNSLSLFRLDADIKTLGLPVGKGKVLDFPVYNTLDPSERNGIRDFFQV